jgi:hypothetical protein
VLKVTAKYKIILPFTQVCSNISTKTRTASLF